jgi:hypothetical protein
VAGVVTERDVRRALFGRDVLVIASLLVLPVGLGAVETALVTPLALPGYLLLTLGSAFGSHLLPSFALWLFWLPFVGGSYVLAICLAGAWRLANGRWRRGE